MRVMVLGGYGNFGARICRALTDDPLVELLVAGRDGNKAKAFAARLGGRSHQGVAVDFSSTDFAQLLQNNRVELLVHTAGPFQGQDYAVAWACAKAGVHYIDLADGRRFVCDFAETLQAAFLASDRVAIAGASTVPALSSAVVDALCAGWSQIDTLDICIAPAQTAPRGVATLEAVLSYCGAPLQVWLAGTWQTVTGWANPKRVSFQRLAPRLGSPCDVPDLELFPERYRVKGRVEFLAAVEVTLAQRAFSLLAWLRKAGLLKKPPVLAAFLNFAAKVFDPLGSRLGGMVVRVEGLDGRGQRVRRSWHIAADNDHGPEIPCMPAILLVRRMAGGERFKSGAYACVSRHMLSEFAPEFAKWGMLTDLLDESGAGVAGA